ncbi:MAG: hypothetical protein ACXABD_09130 [Candidatus Thorarchaeota archaeon]|jgi:hypothetical protein
MPSTSIAGLLKHAHCLIERYIPLSAATTTETKRKIGAFTILTTLVLIAALVWGTYTVILIQGEAVRTQNPHERVSEVEPWEYNINWAGGRSNWFDDIN